MTISRNISVMAQGASSSGILAGGYGGLGASVPPTTAGNVLFTADGSVWSSTQKIVRGTSVTLTNQTSVDFTSIPSWVKRVSLMFNNVSSSGTSNWLIQIGSGSITSSGYNSIGAAAVTGAAQTIISSTAAFIMYNDRGDDIRSGLLTIANTTANIYVSNYVTGGIGATRNPLFWGSGSISLGGALDQVRLTTVNGTDTFDAGSVNILYE
jgi:hypothetical protein